MERDTQLYTPGGVALGTLLGTLAGGAALLWLNYRVLGYPRLANKVAIAGGASYVVIVLVASLLPDEAWVGIGFVMLQTLIGYQAANLLQGDAVRYHLSRGAAPHSLLTAAAVGVLAGLSVMLLLVMLSRLLGLAALPGSAVPA